MIYENTPWDSNKNIASAYNRFMKKLDLGEYALFKDADAMFTTSDYGLLIENCIKKHPDVPVFSAITNRVACTWQVSDEVDITSNDMEYHRLRGRYLADKYKDKCEDVTDKQLMSGMCFVVKKDWYDKVGGLLGDSMLGIDNQIHVKVRQSGERLMLMRGVYVYHYYSNYWFGKEGGRDTKHLY